MLLVSIRVLGTSSVVGQLTLVVRDLLSRPLLHKLHQTASETRCLSHSSLHGLQHSNPALHRSTSSGISSTNHLTPPLRTRMFWKTLWHTLTKLDELHLSILQPSTDLCKLQALAHLNEFSTTAFDPVHVKISCRQVHPLRPSAATVQAQSTRHPSVITVTFVTVNQSVRSTKSYVQPLLRYHVRVRSGFLVSLWWYRAIHSLPIVMRTRVLWMSCRDPHQNANPVVVWLGLVSRVVRSSWSRGSFVH